MLIIWDFDGVICDSDDIWAENWCKLLKSEKDIEISEQEKRELLIGISEKDKAKRLEDHFSGLKIDAAFKKKLNKLHDFGMKNLLVLTNGVDKIFADSRFKQCIATGGNQYQNDTKIIQSELINIFQKTIVLQQIWSKKANLIRIYFYLRPRKCKFLHQTV